MADFKIYPEWWKLNILMIEFFLDICVSPSFARNGENDLHLIFACTKLRRDFAFWNIQWRLASVCQDPCNASFSVFCFFTCYEIVILKMVMIICWGHARYTFHYIWHFQMTHKKFDIKYSFWYKCQTFLLEYNKNILSIRRLFIEKFRCVPLLSYKFSFIERNATNL